MRSTSARESFLQSSRPILTSKANLNALGHSRWFQTGKASCKTSAEQEAYSNEEVPCLFPSGSRLAWFLRDRTERDVYVASTWHRPGDREEHSRHRKLHTVKGPEGRAPAQIVVAALNTYLAPMRERAVMRVN